MDHPDKTKKAFSFGNYLTPLVEVAEYTGWFSAVFDALGPAPTECWGGSLLHSTSLKCCGKIEAEGFVPVLQEHSTLGLATYFFPAKCAREAETALAHAKAFYYHYSRWAADNHIMPGCVIKGDYVSEKVFNTENQRGRDFMRKFDKELSELLRYYNASEIRSGADGVNPEDSSLNCIRWVMFQKIFPAVECIKCKVTSSVGPLCKEPDIKIIGVLHPLSSLNFKIHQAFL